MHNANERTLVIGQGRKFLGWQVLAALWVVFFVNMGLPFYGAAVINAEMAKDLNLGRGELGLGVTVLLLTIGFLSPVTAWVVNRIGARRTLFIACLIHALGAFILAHWVTQGWQYVVAFGLIIGTAGGSTYLSAQACVALWFEKKCAFALSILFASVGVAGFLTAPLLARIIAAAGGSWRAGWYFVIGMAIIAGLSSLLFVKNRPDEYGQTPDGHVDTKDALGSVGSNKKKTVYRTPDTWTIKDAVKTRIMWIIVAASAGYAIPLVTIISHAVPHLKDLGHPPVVAAMSLGILAFCSIIGKLGGGFLCDRFEPRYVWLVAMSFTATSVAITVRASTTVDIYLLGMLMGLGYGTSLVCWSAMVVNYFGASAFASVMGIQFPANTAITAVIPFLIGLVYDAQGTYVYAFYAVAAYGFATTLLLITATPPEHPSNDRGRETQNDLA